MMSQILKRTIPLAIITIIGTLLVIEFFIADDLLKAFRSNITLWGVIIYNAAAIVGAAFLWINHGKNLISTGSWEKKLPSAVALVTFLIVIGIAAFYGPSSSQYNTMYGTTLAEIMLTTFGIIYIYTIESAYRAFRIKTIDAAALFVSGLSYFLREIPLMVAWVPAIVPISDWILNYPSRGALAVGVLTAAIGAIMVGVRTIAQREPSVMD
jgi:hypothetical protein